MHVRCIERSVKMSAQLQTLLRDALLNNSYDYDAMHNSLKKTLMNSYSYLYSLQKANIEYVKKIPVIQN